MTHSVITVMRKRRVVLICNVDADVAARHHLGTDSWRMDFSTSLISLGILLASPTLVCPWLSALSACLLSNEKINQKCLDGIESRRASKFQSVSCVCQDLN